MNKKQVTRIAEKLKEHLLNMELHWPIEVIEIDDNEYSIQIKKVFELVPTRPWKFDLLFYEEIPATYYDPPDVGEHQLCDSVSLTDAMAEIFKKWFDEVGQELQQLEDLAAEGVVATQQGPVMEYYVDAFAFDGEVSETISRHFDKNEAIEFCKELSASEKFAKPFLEPLSMAQSEWQFRVLECNDDGHVDVVFGQQMEGGDQ